MIFLGPCAFEENKACNVSFLPPIAEKLFENLDDQFDLRTSQTASTAMQCLAKIGKLISLANCFLGSSSVAGINGRFGRLDGKLGVGSGLRVILNSRDIERVFFGKL